MLVTITTKWKPNFIGMALFDSNYNNYIKMFGEWFKERTFGLTTGMRGVILWTGGMGGPEKTQQKIWVISRQQYFVSCITE